MKTGSYPGLVNTPTLNLRIFCHVEESPAQGGGCGFRSSHEKIQNTNNQIFLIKSAVVLPLILKIHANTHFKTLEMIKKCLYWQYYLKYMVIYDGKFEIKPNLLPFESH